MGAPLNSLYTIGLTMKDFGQNVKIALNGTKLQIEIDLEVEVGKTTSGNPRIAKTGGFQGYQDLTIKGKDFGLQVGMYEKGGKTRTERVEL